MEKREIGIDLMKVMMMFGIIMFHMANHSQVDLLNAPVSVSWGFEAFCKIWGGVGDCVFVLVTGYLYCEKKFKWNRIIQLWGEVWFYSVILGLFCLITGLNNVSIKGIIKMLFPVIYNEYPFFSAYVVLYLLIPFLNHLGRTISRKQQGFLICVLMVVVSVIPTFSMSSWIMTETQLPMFIVLYFIGMYIKKYGNACSYKKTVIWGIFCVMICIMWISEIVFQIIGVYPFYLVWDMNKLPVVLAAISLFYLSKGLVINLKKVCSFIIFLSGSVFGVYLIHMHRILKTLILDVWFDNTYTYGRWLLMPQIVFGTIGIFCVCVIIDKIRIVTVEKICFPIIVKYSERFKKKVDKYLTDL